MIMTRPSNSNTDVESAQMNEGSLVQESAKPDGSRAISSSKRAVVIDAMATLQELSAKAVKNCKELADEYLKVVEKKCEGYSEGHIIFDHYDVIQSLKPNTRERRKGT